MIVGLYPYNNLSNGHFRKHRIYDTGRGGGAEVDKVEMLKNLDVVDGLDVE